MRSSVHGLARVTVVKVLLTGADGQVARELRATVPPHVELLPFARAELDITDAAQVSDTLARHRPDWVINTAAFTAVDRAESERDAAFAVNARGAANLARAVAALPGRLLQVSTEYVFAGDQGRPYATDQPVSPLSIYGRSKAEGEREVLAALGARALLVRTSWVYSRHGRNFVRTMLGLMQRGQRVRVVADQVGSPTWAQDLARAFWRMIERDLTGIRHWRDAGVASWYDFAVAIQEEARSAGLLRDAVDVEPIRTRDFAAAAVRPPCAVLEIDDTVEALGYAPAHWRSSLRAMLRELSSSVQVVPA